MISLIQNQTVPVILTLSEKTSLSNPVYLFRFVNDSTGEVKVFTATDTVNSNQRFNRFLIESLDENGMEDLTDGKPILSPTGYQTYQIGEIEVSSPQSLLWADIVSIVETGKVFVKNTSENPIVEFKEAESIDQIVYFD